MKKRMAFVCSVLIILLASSSAFAEKAFIYLEDSDEAVETAIGKHLRVTRKWNLSIKYLKSNPQDAYIKSNFGLNKDDSGEEDVTLFIDTQIVQRKSQTKEPIMMRIKLLLMAPNGQCRVKDSDAVLAWLNNWGREKWGPGKMYIDKDGDVIGEDFILLHKDAPVHLEQITEHISLLLETYTDATFGLRKAGLVM